MENIFATVSGAPVDAPVDTPVDTPADAPADAPADTPADAPADKSDPIGHKKPWNHFGLSSFFCVEYCNSCNEPGTKFMPLTYHRNTNNINAFYSTCDSEECISICKKMYETEGRKDYVFGSLFRLKDTLVNVRRSNGEIDNGWKIRPGIFDSKSQGCRIIICRKEIPDGNYIDKEVPIEMIIELNP